jgi:hypothetical protein
VHKGKSVGSDCATGGGTTLVEALALGRDAIGIDISPLAEFVATGARASSHLTRRWRRQSRANPSLKSANSLLAGTLQGISSIRGSAARKWQQKRAINQSVMSQFPTHPNREFFAALQGI